MSKTKNACIAREKFVAEREKTAEAVPADDAEQAKKELKGRDEREAVKEQERTAA